MVRLSSSWFLLWWCCSAWCHYQRFNFVDMVDGFSNLLAGVYCYPVWCVELSSRCRNVVFVGNLHKYVDVLNITAHGYCVVLRAAYTLQKTARTGFLHTWFVVLSLPDPIHFEFDSATLLIVSMSSICAHLFSSFSLQKVPFSLQIICFVWLLPLFLRVPPALSHDLSVGDYIEHHEFY